MRRTATFWEGMRCRLAHARFHSIVDTDARIGQVTMRCFRCLREWHEYDMMRPSTRGMMEVELEQEVCGQPPRNKFWHSWVGAFDGRPSMYIRTLFNRWGRKIDLHKMVRPDDLECFHTHPAWAIRIVLWGGYVEELGDEYRQLHIDPQYRWVRPFTVSLVEPHCEHRIHSLLNGKSSYSLWLRGRKVANINIRGC